MSSNPPSLQRTGSAPNDLIVGQSHMAGLIRAHDWNATALGQIEGWSDGLLSAINMMLACAFPSLVFWGKDLVQFYNDAFIPLLAERHPSGLGQTAEQCWSDAWQIVGPNLKRVMDGRETVYYEDTIVPILRDGRLQDIHWTYNYSPIFARGGEVLGVLVICQDITSEVQDRITGRLSQVLEATTDAVVSVDRNWNFSYLNPRATQLYASERQLLGMNLWEAFPGAVYEGSPYVEHYSRAMDEHVSSSFQEYYPEPLNRWLQIDVYPTPDGIVTFSRDVTEEMNAREALKAKSAEAERQLAEIETVYRTAPIGLALFDIKDFRYLRLNDRQADFFGLKPEQIVGRTLTEMAPIEGLRELFEQVLAGTPVINFPLEGELVTNPGEHRYWTVSYFPVVAPDGTVQGITAASLEVTQQKKVELALIQSEKLAVVGRLAASIAHEINNPLESVTNLLYLAENSEDLAETKSYIQIAERELRRVSVIANQTLRFHKQSSSPQEISGDQLIESVVSMFQSRIVNSGIRVEERKRTAVTVRCFEGEIRQVLSNLVSNAIDAMQPLGGGRLLLRSHAGRDWKTGRPGLVLTVADTGSGMPAAVAKRIFEPFYTTKGTSGTGLGLWVSSEIIHRHEGTLRFRSSLKQGSSGTVFSLFLPFDAVNR